MKFSSIKKLFRRKSAQKERRPFFDKNIEQTNPTFFSDSKGIQPKLTIGKANDPLESEADAAARQIISQQIQRASQKEEEKPVQKAEQKEEEKPVQKAEQKEEEKPVQKAEREEEKTQAKLLQRQEDKKMDEEVAQAKFKPDIQASAEKEGEDAASISSQNLENLLNRRKGRGFELPEALRREMEAQYKFGFSQVRIHTDPEANSMCESIHAQAFTHGYDIYFNEGKYNPNSSEGKELLAHELAHVVQQKG